MSLKERFTKLIKIKPSGPKSVVGLDIGTYSIKSCLVKKEADIKELIGFAVVPIKDSNIKEAIQEAVSLTTHQIKSVNISTGTEGVVIRQITFPKMSQDELNSALKFEAEKYIPFKISDVIMDCQILKQDIEPGKMLVLLAAAKKDIIEKRLNLVKEVGLKTDVIDVDTLSLVNTFNYIIAGGDTERKVSALLNIGHSATSIMILKEGLPFISREIFIAGRDLTKQIADTLNLDIKEAENLKCNPGDKSKEVFDACQPLLEKLCSQVRMSFDYFESQSSISVEEVYLSGGVSKLGGLDKFFENLLGAKIKFWDSFGNLKIENGLNENRFKQELSYLAVALGLALR